MNTLLSSLKTGDEFTLADHPQLGRVRLTEQTRACYLDVELLDVPTAEGATRVSRLWSGLRVVPAEPAQPVQNQPEPLLTDAHPAQRTAFSPDPSPDHLPS